jgi:RNA recognition motif-containing protein
VIFPVAVSRLKEMCFFCEASVARGMTTMKRLYVGNLSFNASSDDLRELFSQYGSVTSADVISDRDTGRSRGFGFVEMADGGEAAIEALNGQEMMGRTLTVNEAKPREPRRSGGGYGRRERY